MIDIDITMPIQILNIFVLIFIMNAILYKPIRGILAERDKKTTDLGADIETLDKNARLRLAEIDKKVRGARAEAKTALEKVRSSALAEQAEKLGAVRSEIDAAKGEQLSQVRSQFSTAQQQLAGQVDAFAKEIAGKILGRAV